MPGRITVRRVIEATAAHFRMDVEALLSPHRTQPLSSSGRGGADMAALSADQMKLLIVETRQRFVELDHEDWNEKTGRYGHTTLEKWAQAARLTAPVEWWEIVRILAQGWDYYGGSDLPGALIGWSSAATSRSAMT